MLNTERLTVVGGPEGRKDAAEMEAAFGMYHGAVHDLKQIGTQLDELFTRLTESAEVLKEHGIRVDADAGIDKPVLAALQRWRAAVLPEHELPEFIERS